MGPAADAAALLLLFGVFPLELTEIMVQKTWFMALSLAALLVVGLAPAIASFDGDCDGGCGKDDDSVAVAHCDCDGDCDGECDGSCGDEEESSLVADCDCDGECDGSCSDGDEEESLVLADCDCDGDCDGSCGKDDEAELLA